MGAVEKRNSKGHPVMLWTIQLLLEEYVHSISCYIIDKLIYCLIILHIKMSNSRIINFRNKYTTLWGTTITQIKDDFFKNNPEPSVVVVTSTIVKTFRGSIYIIEIEFG